MSPPTEPSALDTLHEEFKSQNQESLASEHLFRSLVEPYDVQFKEYLVGKAYEALCNSSTPLQSPVIDEREHLVDSLEQLQKFTQYRNPEEARRYGQLASALSAKMGDEYCVRIYKVDASKLPSREILFSDIQSDVDTAKIIAKDSKRIIKRTTQLLAERGAKIAKDPGATAATIAAGVLINPYVLGGMIGWQLISNHKELWHHSKDFARLLRDDTPEGIAHLITFCIEAAVLHKASSSAVGVGVPQLKKIKSMLSECVSKATQEQSLALAAQASGVIIETPNVDMLRGMRDAAKLASSEQVAVASNVVKSTESIASEGFWSMPKGGVVINGRKYTEHALERMAPNTDAVCEELSKRALAKGLVPGTDKFRDYVRPRDIPPMVVEETINSVKPVPHADPNKVYYYGDDITVIANLNGDVITAYPKKN